MEALAPPLALAIVVRSSIECGESVRFGIQKYIEGSSGEFSNQVRTWLVLFDQGAYEKQTLICENMNSAYRRAIMNVLLQGLKGSSIYKNLLEVEEEIKIAAERELSEFVSLLPLKLLLPLLFLQFPAYLILILSPLIRQYLESL